MEPAEMQELLSMLDSYDGKFGPVPEDLQVLAASVKRARGQQGAAAEDTTQEVTPQAGYVIKTADQDDRKVFINMCHSKQVPAPSSWADGMAPEKVLQALEDLQADQPNADAEAMRFALSCSELQLDTDKQGAACVCVDCIVNSDVMAAVQQHRPLKAFVNELALDWVGRKHQLQLNPQYKLPKMAYKGGEVRSQRVRCDPRPLVADVTPARDSRDEEPPSFPLLASKAAKGRPKAAAGGGTSGKGRASAAAEAVGGGGGAAAAAAAASGWSHETACQGSPVTHMVVSIQLPPGCSASSGNRRCSPQDIAVELCGMQLRVRLAPAQHQDQQQQAAQQQQQQCCVQLPFAAAADGAAASLQAASGRLRVELLYLPVQAWAQQLAREAPHAFAALPVAHDAYMELDA